MSRSSLVGARRRQEVSVVPDASAVAAWLMPDEAPPEALVAIVTGEFRWSRRGCWVELRNILIVGERRGHLRPEAVDAFLAAVQIRAAPPVEVRQRRAESAHRRTEQDQRPTAT